MTMLQGLPTIRLVAAILAPGAEGAEPEPEGRASVVVEVSDSGFHWLDAGIGVAATLALVLLVIGLTLSVRHSNGRR